VFELDPLKRRREEGLLRGSPKEAATDQRPLIRRSWRIS